VDAELEAAWNFHGMADEDDLVGRSDSGSDFFSCSDSEVIAPVVGTDLSAVGGGNLVPDVTSGEAADCDSVASSTPEVTTLEGCAKGVTIATQWDPLFVDHFDIGDGDELGAVTADIAAQAGVRGVLPCIGKWMYARLNASLGHGWLATCT